MYSQQTLQKLCKLTKKKKCFVDLRLIFSKHHIGIKIIVCMFVFIANEHFDKEQTCLIIHRQTITILYICVKTRTCGSNHLIINQTYIISKQKNVKS